MTKENKTEGKFWKCVHAESNFYTRGKVYELVENEVGDKGFIASDGLFDRKSMVVSRFIAATNEEFMQQSEQKIAFV